MRISNLPYQVRVLHFGLANTHAKMWGNVSTYKLISCLGRKPISLFEGDPRIVTVHWMDEHTLCQPKMWKISVRREFVCGKERKPISLVTVQYLGLRLCSEARRRGVSTIVNA
jgi:hypothetical protein